MAREDYTEGPADKSNWPSDYLETYTPRQRKTLDFIAIDNENETICKAKDMEAALQFVRGKRGLVIRPVYLTEDDMRQEDQQKRDLLWLEQVYKPTPARRAHR